MDKKKGFYLIVDTGEFITICRETDWAEHDDYRILKDEYGHLLMYKTKAEAIEALNLKYRKSMIDPEYKVVSIEYKENKNQETEISPPENLKVIIENKEKNLAVLVPEISAIQIIKYLGDVLVLSEVIHLDTPKYQIRLHLKGSGHVDFWLYENEEEARKDYNAIKRLMEC